MQRRVIIKNSLANFLGNATNKLVRILLVPLQINLLGTQAFGLLGFYAVLGAIIAFLDLGLTQTANREVARLKTDPNQGKQEIRNLIRTFEVIYWLIAITIGIIVLFSSNYLAKNWIKAPELSPKSVAISLGIMGVLLAARWPVSLYQGILLGLEKQVVKNVVGISIEFLNGIGSVIVLLLKPTIELFFLWQLIVGFIEISGYVWFCWRSVAEKGLNMPTFKFSIIKRVWRYAFGINVISIIGSIFGRADSLILSKLFTIDFLGYYSLAQKVTPLIGLFPGAVIPATTPSLIANYEQAKNDELKKMYHLETKLISFIGVGISLFLTVYSYPLLKLWTQSELTAQLAYIPFSIISAATIFENMTNSVNQLSLACGFTRPTITVNFLVGISVAIITLVLAPKYGILGAAIAWGLSRILMYLLFPLLVHRLVLRDELINWYKNDTLPFIVLGIICSIGGLLLNNVFNGINEMFWILSLVITGGAYLVLAYVFHLIPKVIFSFLGNEFQLIRRKNISIP
jgi:O-antigen/teichoic acid export membrane protein